MNQILYTGGKKRSDDTQRVIIFFVIFIVLFAFAVIVIGTNLLNKIHVVEENKNASNTTNSIPEEPIKEANISIQFSAENGAVKLNVNSDTIISKVIYWWDEETPTEIDVNQTQYELSIQTKHGTHMLNVDVIDENGVKESKKQTVIGKYDKPEEEFKPEVTISTDTISKYVITASDETLITKIVVILNGESQEIEVNQKTYEYKIDIPVGNSLIDVTVYNSNGLSANKKAKITGYGQ